MSTRQNRETAYRVFAAEFDDASLSYAESDEERAPNYVVTPTGARINRLFVVGVLTEIESVNDEQLRARIVDPTGAFVVYAGQYQPDALSFLERAETPAFVAVTGKARTFQPNDSERVFTSIRPETLSEVDDATRDRFTVDTAERTLERVRTMRDALRRDERGDAVRETLEETGVEAGLAAGIPRAISHYGTTPAYLDALGEMALDAARVVAGERDAVGSLDIAPADSGDIDKTDPRAVATDESRPESAESVAETAGGTAAVSGSESESPPESEGQATPEATAESNQPESGTDVETTATDSATESGETDIENPEEFELDAEERERIEDQFGTDFESAAEVGEPGEADIETPTPEESSTESSEEPEPIETADTEAAESSETVEPTASETPTAESSETETDAAELTDDASGDESDGETMQDEGDETDIDPEEAVVTAMRELDDGEGAERDAVIERVEADHGLTPEAVEDGIQSALMSGECYEADDDMFKPI